LSLRSESDCFVPEVCLTCFRKSEKTGRRFCNGGGELVGMGEEGGLDRGASSDHTAGEFFGLDVEGSEGSRSVLQ
jgi:hypothetical protein